MKKVFKNKVWIAAAVILAVVLIGLYLPLPSNHEQTLKGFIYQCNEDGKVISMIPVDEVAVEVDVNRHQFLLNDATTLKGRIEFSNYIKKANDGGPLPVENVAFVLESRYGGSLADNQQSEFDSIEGVDQDRAMEKKEESAKHLTCSDIYYEDDEAYYTGISYADPSDMPIYREMRYSKNFDRLMWIDYHNQYVYICADEEASSDVMLGYFTEAKVK